jgi:ribonuclease P protein component
MLPKNNRLKKKKDIERVFKKGRSFREDFLIFKTLENDLGYCRFAFIVSKKVSLKATERNKIRRRLSEIIYPNLKKIKSGEDVLLIVMKNAVTKDFKETERAANKLLKAARLII